MTTLSSLPSLVDFQDAIRTLLVSRPSGYTEHELLSLLAAPPYGFFERDCFSQPFRLFQTHFLLFHILYQIRDQLEREHSSTLEISPLRICIAPYQQGSSSITQPDPLESYYRDWQNLVTTQPEQVDSMLDNFWRRMVTSTHPGAPEVTEALASLELAPSSTYDEVKQQYRRLAMKYHPDRGGDDRRLRDINAAKRVLDRFFQAT